MNTIDKVEQARRAIQEVFNDTSVSPAETKRSLLSLQGDIELMLDTLGEEPAED